MSNFIAFKTILFKEVRRFMRIWPQTILPPAITTTLYFLIFGKLMGERIGSVNGVSYMEYLVPGVILMSVITHSYGNVVASFYSTKFQHHIEELLVAPVFNSVILAGYIGGGIVRGVVVGLVVTAISMLFAPIAFQHIGIATAVLLLTACLFSLAGFLNAVFADSFDDISLIPNFVLTPLSYLGGVFYSISMLPEIWQKISLANPIVYLINAFRFGLIGVTDVDICVAFVMAIGFIVFLFSLSWYCLYKGVGIKN